MGDKHDHSLCRTVGQHQLNLFFENSALSQEGLGELIGTSQQTAGKYLGGQAVPVRYSIVKACEDKCGVTPGAFEIPLKRGSSEQQAEH